MGIVAQDPLENPRHARAPEEMKAKMRKSKKPAPRVKEPRGMPREIFPNGDPLNPLTPERKRNPKGRGG